MEESPAIDSADALAVAIRRAILDASWRAGVGHIGSSLSIADIVSVLLHETMRPLASDDPDRDRLILSKGHAALALYAGLSLTGRLPHESLESYCGDGSRLGVHPEHSLDGIDFSTGSLGQGLAIGTGAALAGRLQGSCRRVFVLLSDAECNEGSTWEAIMFAAHHGLSNLVAIVDLNGQQALGYTRDILDLAPLASRWHAFGWEATEVDGHDRPALAAALQEAGPAPRVVVAHTTFGKGVSFMEGLIEWHYLPMTAQEHRIALEELSVPNA